MTTLAFATVSYQWQDRQISWCGINMENGDDFDAFMSNEVRSRLDDEEGNTQFETHLQGLASTQFERENLDAILTAEVSERRDWAVGEATAEAYLTCEYGITWPWNTERDKRNPNASLPGADLVGFIEEEEGTRLVLGEVKSSSDTHTPPSVMNGRSGMTSQISELATNLNAVFQLIRWLFFRCKNTSYEARFNDAIRKFINSDCKAVAFFGVLIRDTEPNEFDLQARGRTLAGSMHSPTTCNLIAIYLPCTIRDLPTRVLGDNP